jgi:undecaprenyl-diphosphatase
MLTIFQAVILGILQGITEFLPVSSSGHLVVVQQLFGWKAEDGIILAFDVALHVGTLLAVLIALKGEIVQILTGRAWRLFGVVVLATLPAVIVGFGIKDMIEAMFSSVTVVGIAWLVTGTFLWGTKYIKIPPAPPLEKGGEGGFAVVSWRRSVLIGCAQAIAIIPGISRSGSTMTAGIFLGLSGEAAAKFSFLMAVPAIAGGAVLDIKDIMAFPKEGLPQLIIGTVVSFIVAYLSIKWLLAIISRGKFHWFGVYCWVIGILTLIWVAS